MTAWEAWEKTFELWQALAPQAMINGSGVAVSLFPDERLQYGLPVGNPPRPTRPYAMAMIETPQPLGGYFMLSDGDANVARQGRVSWKVSINSYQAPGLLEAFRRSLDGRISDLGARTMRGLNLGLGRVLTEPRALSLALETRFEYRELFEFELNTADVFNEAIPAVTEMSGTVTTESPEIVIEFEGGL